MEGHQDGPCRKLGFSPPPPEAPRVNLHKPRGHFFCRGYPARGRTPGGNPRPRSPSQPAKPTRDRRQPLPHRGRSRAAPRARPPAPVALPRSEAPVAGAVPLGQWNSRGQLIGAAITVNVAAVANPAASRESPEVGLINDGVPVGVSVAGCRAKHGTGRTQTWHGIMPTRQRGSSNRAARSRTRQSSSSEPDPGRPARGQPCLRASY